MTPKLRALAALPEDLGSILSTHMELTTICNFTSGDSDALFGPPQEPGMHMAHRHIHAGKTNQKILNLTKFLDIDRKKKSLYENPFSIHLHLKIIT